MPLPPNRIPLASWFVCILLCSVAVRGRCVNVRYGRTLTPLILAPVTAGAASVHGSWGRVAVQSRHTNFLGVTDAD